MRKKIWLGHPIYRPFDDHTVAFCHEGPHDLVDARMWLVNEDGSHVRKVKAHAPRAKAVLMNFGCRTVRR